MAKDRWIELLVVGVILSTLGWLSATVFSLNSTVSRVDGAMQETSRRIDRIADVLPDMRVKLAGEELRKSLDLALLCELPKQDDTGSWRLGVNLVNLKQSTNTRYTIAVSGPDDRKVAQARYIISGASRVHEDSIPLATVIHWHQATDDVPETPDYLDASCSTVLHASTAKEYRNALESYEEAIQLLDAHQESVVKVGINSKTSAGLFEWLEELAK